MISKSVNMAGLVSCIHCESTMCLEPSVFQPAVEEEAGQMINRSKSNNNSQKALRCPESPAVKAG